MINLQIFLRYTFFFCLDYYILYNIQFNQALYSAEHKARQAVEIRANIQKELLVKQKEKMESDLRNLARIAKKEKEK